MEPFPAVPASGMASAVSVVREREKKLERGQTHTRMHAPWRGTNYTGLAWNLVVTVDSFQSLGMWACHSPV